MRRLRMVAAGMIASGAAAAADPGSLLPPAPDLDVLMGPSDGAGFYARADLGWVDSRDRSTLYSRALPLNARRVDGTVAFGGGIGYRAGHWLRMDLTLDHRLDAEVGGLRPDRPGPAGARRDAAEVRSTTALANLYLDLPLFTGVTPYVGAGLGLGLNQVSEATSRALGTGNASVAGRLPSRTTADFAWGLTGGVSAELAAGIGLDLGYRYVHLGTARSGADAMGAALRAGTIEAHEWRLGLRYTFE